MNIIDITRPIVPGMPVYPGDPEVEIEPADSGINRITMGSHTGTHVDAPSHLIGGGKGADALPMEALVGPAHVVEAGLSPLDASGVARLIPSGCERVLLKLSGRAAGETSGVTIDVSAARELARRGVRFVGVEGMSIDAPSAEGLPAHRAILGTGGVIAEGLELSHVKPGTYELVCLPMKFVGLDGSPARAVLVDRDGERSP